MDYDYREMGRLIQRLRRDSGISQDVLSGLAGIGRSHLAMIEAGRKNASVETLWRISAAMDITISELFSKYESSARQNTGFYT